LAYQVSCGYTRNGNKRAGVAVGLAWTPAGGDVLFIEANKMKGKGGFTITGQIGDVMKESMQAALTWVRSNEVSLAWMGLHQGHGSAHPRSGGAIPKDAAFGRASPWLRAVSLLTDVPVHPLTRDDREITHERQCAAGRGIKEKFLAAKRAGVRDVILPTDCKQQSMRT